jgi:hypothetical protein
MEKVERTIALVAALSVDAFVSFKWDWSVWASSALFLAVYFLILFGPLSALHNGNCGRRGTGNSTSRTWLSADTHVQGTCNKIHSAGFRAYHRAKPTTGEYPIELDPAPVRYRLKTPQPSTGPTAPYATAGSTTSVLAGPFAPPPSRPYVKWCCINRLRPPCILFTVGAARLRAFSGDYTPVGELSVGRARRASLACGTQICF